MKRRVNMMLPKTMPRSTISALTAVCRNGFVGELMALGATLMTRERERSCAPWAIASVVFRILARLDGVGGAAAQGKLYMDDKVGVNHQHFEHVLLGM